MSNRAGHVLAGAVAGVAVYGVFKHFRKEEWDLGQVISCSLLGAIGGMLPDILEPAKSPQHRKFFHSSLCAVLIHFGKQKLYEKIRLSSEQQISCDVFLAGYFSHLGLDSLTPKGLPIF